MNDMLTVAGGAGRSGSTLIGEVLAAATGRLMVGEVALFWRALDADLPCGCGRQLDRCDFWSAVLSRLTRTDADFAATVYQQFRLRMQSSLRPHRPDPDTPEWSSAHADLIRAVHACAPHGHVDTSKQLPHLEMLAELTANTNRFVHLTRDPRAVAYSWANSKPIPGEDGRPMRTMSASRSTLSWLLHNRRQRQLATRFVHRVTASYEQFCADPARFVTDLTAAVGDEDRIDRAILDELGDRRFASVPNHALAGNPGRAGSPAAAIRRDDRWVNGLKRTDALTAWTLGAVEARRYGYRFGAPGPASGP